MSHIPEDLLYAKSHEWVRLGPDGGAIVGISDYAQLSLGDITFVQLPGIESMVVLGVSFGVVESVKAASDVYSPIAGRVVAINSRLTASPEIVNSDPYGEGWLMRLDNLGSSTGLMDHNSYAAYIG